MKNAFGYETIGVRTYKTALDDGHTILMFRENKYFQCYVKRCDQDGSETDYKFMFGLPTNENTAQEAMDIAVANAPEYDFMFEDSDRLIPTIPVFYPNVLLHACDGCGNIIDAGDKFCRDCGRQLLWELMLIDSND